MTTTQKNERLEALDMHWRAANYLSACQIYLLDNPLLREPLRPAHIKPRLLGHWGTAPGLNLIYSHLNRLIQDTDAEMLYIAGPGHGGPAIRANVYFEGVMTEVYPDIGMDIKGLTKFLREFSWPGACQATSARQPRARSTKAVSWAMRWFTPAALYSTIPT